MKFNKILSAYGCKEMGVMIMHRYKLNSSKMEWVVINVKTHVESSFNTLKEAKESLIQQPTEQEL